MQNETLIETKTAAICKSLGWERLEGLGTLESLNEIRASFARLRQNDTTRQILADVQTLLALAQKYQSA